MEVPLRLARREASTTTADAFLLLTDGPGAPASACAWLGEVAAPEVHRVRDGFLLIPRESSSRTPPGAIRLRRVGGDLYVPVDADLRPALLPDEIVASTRDRGLIVLPDGTILAFDPDSPLPVARWLAPARIIRAEWQPFPPRPARPNSLAAIERPAPPAAVIELLGGGAPDDVEPLGGPGEVAGGKLPEDVRPPKSPIIGRAVGGTLLGIGAFLVSLGKLLRAPGLARYGGKLARSALEKVPRLSEKVLGDQEAALREVLRQLQSGDVEKGLRRAPIAIPDPEQPTRISTDARLASRDPRYSLRDLIGSGGGVASGWLGGGDVWVKLAQEYRMLAQEAAARGDHRRAAYLYGVLLRDPRSAANALMAGGLFRDAAILFRDRLKDLMSAASAFDRAGDHDEALRLYDHLELYEQAGNLLMKLGERDRAIDYFIRAAHQLAARGSWLGAGDLLRTRAGRGDLATPYYRLGWEQASADAVVCGTRLLDDCFMTENLAGVMALLDEAETLLATRSRNAGRFFNHAIKVGETYLPAARRADLTDRVRLVFAGHLRAAGEGSTEAGRLASDLFGQSGSWPGPVVRDATFAARGSGHRVIADKSPSHGEAFHLGEGRVLAVAVARGTFDVFIATTQAVVCWRANEGRVIPICSILDGDRERVLALSTDPQGKILYALVNDRNRQILRCYDSDRGTSFGMWGEKLFSGSEGWVNFHLQPSASFRDGDYHVTLANAVERVTLMGRTLRSLKSELFASSGHHAHLLVEGGGGWAWDWSNHHVKYRSPALSEWESYESPTHWTPQLPDGSTLSVPPLDWITPGPGLLEVVGIGKDGCVCWSEFDARDLQITRSRTAQATHPDGYLAVCLVEPSRIVAATRNEIHWLRVSGTELVRQATTALGIPIRPVALISRPSANEVVAVLRDGTAVRYQRP